MTAVTPILEKSVTMELLGRIARYPGVPMAEVIRDLDVSLSTASNRIRSLDAEGYIRREDSAGIQHYTRIYLTERGQEAVDGHGIEDHGSDWVPDSARLPGGGPSAHGTYHDYRPMRLDGQVRGRELDDLIREYVREHPWSSVTQIWTGIGQPTTGDMVRRHATSLEKSGILESRTEGRYARRFYREAEA